MGRRSCLPDQIAMLRGVKLLKVKLLQGDPAVKKLPCPLRRAAVQDAAALLGGGDGQKHGILIVGSQIGVHTVGALHHLQGGIGHADRRLERHSAAVEPSEKNVLSTGQGEEHLLQEPLPIHIAAGLGETLGRALVGLQK